MTDARRARTRWRPRSASRRAPLPVLAGGEREALVERQRAGTLGRHGEVAGRGETDACAVRVERRVDEVVGDGLRRRRRRVAGARSGSAPRRPRHRASTALGDRRRASAGPGRQSSSVKHTSRRTRGCGPEVARRRRPAPVGPTSRRARRGADDRGHRARVHGLVVDDHHLDDDGVCALERREARARARRPVARSGTTTETAPARCPVTTRATAPSTPAAPRNDDGRDPRPTRRAAGAGTTSAADRGAREGGRGAARGAPRRHGGDGTDHEGDAPRRRRAPTRASGRSRSADTCTTSALERREHDQASAGANAAVAPGSCRRTPPARARRGTAPRVPSTGSDERDQQLDGEAAQRRPRPPRARRYTRASARWGSATVNAWSTA